MYITRDATRVVMPWREDLANLIPHAREITHEGARLLVVPNAPEEARLCRNLGVDVPAPIFTRYNWAGQTPWEIQKTTAGLLSENNRFYVLSTMGTGKTRAALFASDYLQSSSAVRRILIAAPLSTLTPVWEQELFRVLPGRRAIVLYGDRAKRLKLLAQEADYYVINHHGLHLLRDALIERGFDVVVIDELAIFRNKGTQLWKAASAVINAPSVKYVWGLTGSPTPKSPVDAWAQIRLLTPARVPRTMTGFRDMTMRQITAFKWTERPEASGIVHAAMQPSVRYSRDDVMELPETTYVDRDIKLSDEAKRAYKMMVDKMRMLGTSGQAITAVNEGVLQSKLLQVAGGFIYTDTHGVYHIPNDDRLRVLEELIDETDHKVLVFVPFVHALKGVAEHLEAAGESVAVVHGATSRAARDRIFNAFQTKTNPRVIIAHPETMAHGLTLTQANTIIWYTPTPRLDIYEQANARITRPGQVNKTLIVHLSGTPVEKLTYARLRKRGQMQGILLDLFSNQEVVL